MLYLRAASITKLKNFSHLKFFEEMQIVVITIKMHQEESGSRTFFGEISCMCIPLQRLFNFFSLKSWAVNGFFKLH